MSADKVSMRAIELYMQERDRAFENDDIEWCRARLNEQRRTPVDDETLILGFHKARHCCGAVSDAKRFESQKWLAERGYCDLLGNRVRVGDPLPLTGAKSLQ